MTPLTRLNTAVLPPMAVASEATAMRVIPQRLRSMRSAKRASCTI